MFLIEAVLKSEKYELGVIIPRGSRILFFEVIYRKNPKENTKDKLIPEKRIFRDSSALLPFSLARITTNFDVKHKKLDIDYKAIRTVTPKLLKYLEHDCRGLHEALEACFNWDLIKKAGAAFTTAGQALRILRTFIEVDFYGLSPKVDAFVRQGYFGGRTEIFKPVYKGKKPLHCYDVNSLYPTIMHDVEMPGNFEASTFDYFPDRHGFYEATVHVPDHLEIPPLGAKIKDKLLFPVGTFSGVWSTLELEYAKSVGVKVLETRRGLLFENKGKFFRPFVETLWKIRENSKKDSVDNTLAKLLLNSCYGRLGLRSDRKQIVVDEGQLGFKELRIIQFKGKSLRIGTVPVDCKSFSNVAIAAWVTSAARIHMHKLFSQCNFEVYYTDTDSLFTTKKIKTGTGLGDLKLEYSCKSAVFLLPKTYLTEGQEKKVVMKGFDKRKIQHFTIDDFKNALEGDLKHMKIIQEPKFATFKTALRMGKLVTLTKGGTRQIKSLYSKRIIIKKGNNWTTKPIKITRGKKNEVRESRPTKSKNTRIATGRDSSRQVSEIGGDRAE